MTDINYGGVKLDELLKFKDLTADATDNDLRALGLACVHRMHLLEPAIRLAASMENALGKYEQVELAVFSGWGDGETNYRATLSNTPMSGGETRTEHAASLAAAIEAAINPLPQDRSEK